MEKPKKITLNFKNGASVTIEQKNITDDMWEALSSVLIEMWLTKEEFKKLYPKEYKDLK